MNGEQRKQCLRENKETNMQILVNSFREGFEINSAVSAHQRRQACLVYILRFIRNQALTMNNITCDETVIRPNSVMTP